MMPPATSPPAYAELHCLSSFSFQRSASQPEELVARAAALGYSALAITDECSVAGVVRAHSVARTLGLKLVLGAEFQVQDPGREAFTAVVLAHNLEGWGNLCQFITAARRAAPKGHYQVGWRGGHYQALWGSLQHCEVLISLPFAIKIEAAAALSMGAKALFGTHCWLAATLHLGANDALEMLRWQQLSAFTGVPLVAVGDVRMHVRSRKPLLDALTAVRLGVPVAQCGFGLQANAEAHLRSRARLAALYPAQWLANTLVVAGRCTFALEELRYHYPAEAVLPDSKMGVQLASGWLDRRTVRKHQRRRLLIDVSHIAMHDHETGIQRVVREIVCKLYCATVAGFDPIAVELKEGRLVRATGWLVARGLLMAVEQGRPDEPIDSFRRDDTLLMLDSSWARYTEFFGVFDSIQALGGRVVTAVYDLLPMKLPAGNFVEGGKEWFEAWFSLAALRSDGLVCISGAVANDVKDWIEQNQARLAIKRTPFICHWHLGSDFAAITPEKTASAEVQAMKAAPYLLMVGTVEPRKSHAIALAAFERLWQRGETLALCIVGKEGWMVAELMGRIRSHPELGRRLFFFDHATDADVTTLYASATGLLLLSKGEGFGLPLIEAAQFGTPIICSDIPVFREIASNFAEYVNHDDPEILASQLADWARTLAANRVKRTSEMPRLSWQDSAHQLLESIAVARNVSALIDDYG